MRNDSRTVHVETLEQRRLLSAAINSQGTLVIDGTNNNDYLTVSLKSGDATKLVVFDNGNSQEFAIASVTNGISFNGANGDDYIAVDEVNGLIDINATITGGNGQDTIHGGNGDDVIDGDNNKDKLYGQNGDDVLLGGNGVDMIYGDAGDDDILGGRGTDHLNGDVGDDDLDGSQGNDDLHGGAGNDDFPRASESEIVDQDNSDNGSNSNPDDR